MYVCVCRSNCTISITSHSITQLVHKPFVFTIDRASPVKLYSHHMSAQSSLIRVVMKGDITYPFPKPPFDLIFQ